MASPEAQERVNRLLLKRQPVVSDEARQRVDDLLGGSSKSQQDDSDSLMARIGEYMSQAPGRAADYIESTVTGKGRKSEIFDLPELGTSGPSVPPFSEEGMRMMGAYATSVDPQQIADIALKTLPGATAYEDMYGNPIINFEGQDYYVNRPGASEADAFQLLAETGAYAPAARSALATRSLAGRAWKVGTRAAATSAGLDIASGALGSEQGVSGERMGLALALGPAFEFLAPAAKAAWRAITGNRSLFNQATGELTKKGVAAAEAAGLSVAEMSTALKESFGRVARTEPQAPVAAGKALKETYDIPYTVGQETQALPAQGLEEAARHGAIGSEAQGRVRQFDIGQEAAIEEAVGKAQKQLGKTGVPIKKERDAGEILQERLTEEVKKMDDKIDDAYELARTKDASLKDPSDLGNLIDSVKEGIKDFDIDADLYPAATKAVKNLEKLRPKKGQPITLTIRKLETERRKLSKLVDAARSKADRAAVLRIKERFDQWQDEAFDSALFSGDQDALDAMKAARALRGEKAVKFQQLGKLDEGGKVIQRMIERDPTPEQMMNWIFGRGKLGSADVAADVMSRLKAIFPEGSLEFDLLRESGWLRMTLNDRGKMLTPRQIKNNVDQALHKNESVMRQLYSEEEIAMMKELSLAIDRTTVPKYAANPSKTAFTIMRIIKQLIARTGTMATFSGAHYTGGGLFTIARLLPAQFSDRLMKKAVQGLPPYRTRAPGGVAGGIAGSQLLPGEER